MSCEKYLSWASQPSSLGNNKIAGARGDQSPHLRPKQHDASSLRTDFGYSFVVVETCAASNLKIRSCKW